MHPPFGGLTPLPIGLPVLRSRFDSVASTFPPRPLFTMSGKPPGMVGAAHHPRWHRPPGTYDPVQETARAWRLDLALPRNRTAPRIENTPHTDCTAKFAVVCVECSPSLGRPAPQAKRDQTRQGKAWQGMARQGMANPPFQKLSPKPVHQK